MYTEAQGLVEVSATLGPFSSSRFMSCPWAMSFFQRLCPARFPPVSFPPQRFYPIFSWEAEGRWSIFSRLSRAVDPACQGVKISGCRAHTLNGGDADQFSSSDLRFYESKGNNCGWSELRGFTEETMIHLELYRLIRIGQRGI